MRRNPRALYDCWWASATCNGKSIDYWVFSGGENYQEDDLKKELKPQGFLLCFSITDRSSFEKLDSVVKGVLKIRGASSLPFTVVGCKGDLEAERQVSDDEARQYAATIGAEYVLTSSTNEIGTQEALSAIIRAIDNA